MDKISKIKSNLQYVDNFLFEKNYLNTCLENCSDCCYDYFYTSLFEFYLILDKLLNVPYNLNYYIIVFF